MKKIAISAAEYSGDLLGADLVADLVADAAKTNKNLSFFGLAGDHLVAVGVQKKWDMSQVCVMGFVEVLKKLPSLLKLRRQMINSLIAQKPDLFIGIDAPDFNFKIEKKLKQAGVKTVHFVSPSVWAWRASRVKKIKQSTDLMLCVFPFEVDFYANHNMPAVFVGHPLANRLKPRQNYTKTNQVLLMPGSRSAEIKAILPSLLNTLPLLIKQQPELSFSLALLDDKLLDWLQPQLDNLGVPVELVYGKSQQQLTQADLVLSASGTATLEALIIGVPMVVVHKLPNITYQIVKRLLTIKYVCLPNILADKLLVPELIQENATPNNIAKQGLELLTTDNTALLMQFKHIAQSLQQDKSVAVSAIKGLLNNETFA